MDKYQTIIYEKEDGITSITLNRPEALNAINRTMFQETGQALDDAEQDSDIRVVVMKGAFSAANCSVIWAPMSSRLKSRAATRPTAGDAFKSVNASICCFPYLARSYLYRRSVHSQPPLIKLCKFRARLK